MTEMQDFSMSLLVKLVFLKVKVNAIIKRASLQMTLKSPLDSLKNFYLAICIDGNNADIYHHRGQVIY
jgi:import receptor subunit TOM70